VKVVFKLNAAQLTIAKLIADELGEKLEGLAELIEAANTARNMYHEAGWDTHVAAREASLAAMAAYEAYEAVGLYVSGNLHAPYDHAFCFNPDQALNLVGGQVVYEGQRHPLQQDGGLDVLVEIAGYTSLKEAFADKFGRLKVVEYQTSDKRLVWYETLSDWEKREEDRILSSGSWGEVLSTMLSTRREVEIPSRFPQKQRLYGLLASGDIRKASAEFSSAEIREMGRLIASGRLG